MKRSIECEKRTVALMIAVYCRGNGHVTDGLCQGCYALLEYSLRRLDCCRFGDGKPTCRKCPVHCYMPRYREEIRNVMRYAGPRMIFTHPIAVLRHLFGL